MRTYFRSGIAAGAAMTASLLFGVVSATALTVQPVLIDDIKISLGETVTRSVKLLNDSEQTVRLKPTVYDAEAADETGFPRILGSKEDSILAGWINAGGVVTLMPKESTIVPIIISVPQNGEPGGHYALVSWGGADVELPKGKAGAGVVGQVAVNVAIDVKGAVVEKGDLVSFATSSGEGKFDKLPVAFTARISNSGNRHFKPKGDVVITNMFGSVVATLPLIAATGGNVLPKSTRAFDVQWNGDFAFGKYTATLNAFFGKAGSGSASVDFWVLPLGLLILWLVIAVVVVLILALLVRNISSSMKK